MIEGSKDKMVATLQVKACFFISVRLVSLYLLGLFLHICCFIISILSNINIKILSRLIAKFRLDLQLHITANNFPCVDIINQSDVFPLDNT